MLVPESERVLGARTVMTIPLGFSFFFLCIMIR